MKVTVIDCSVSGHRETYYKQFAQTWAGTESICRTSVPHCGFAVAHKAANRHTAVRQPYAAIRRTVSAVISGLRILKSEIVDFDVAAARSLERFRLLLHRIAFHDIGNVCG